MKLRMNNISSLQFFQLLRFATLLLIGVVFTKTSLLPAEIGSYETVLFLAGAVSFFWVNGLIQGLLSVSGKTEDRSVQIFNVFLLSSFLTLLVIVSLFFAGRPLAFLLLKNQEIPFLPYLLAYLFFSVPANLVEYIYLIHNKPQQITSYGLISYALMLVLVTAPAISGCGFEYCLAGLVLASAIRYGWLIGLLFKYAKARVSWPFLQQYLILSFPLILSALLSGSAQYIDGFIVSLHFDEATFAVFRYGAREFPLAVLLASAFSTAMIPEFSSAQKTEEAFVRIKQYATRLMHFLFPLSVAMLIAAHALFPLIFNENFRDSATIFNIYLLLIVSRMIFPQTILIGWGKTRIIAWASFLELLVNASLSFWWVNWMGIAGVAYATFVAYVFEKLLLVYLIWKEKGIKPMQYANISILLTYSLLLLLVFYVVEFVIY